MAAISRSEKEEKDHGGGNDSDNHDPLVAAIRALRASFVEWAEHDRRNNEQLRDDIKSTIGAVQTTLDRALTVIDGSLQAIDGSLQAVDTSVKAVDTSVKAVDGSVRAVDGSLQAIDGSVKAVDSSVQGIDGSVKALDGSVQTVSGTIGGLRRLRGVPADMRATLQRVYNRRGLGRR